MFQQLFMEMGTGKATGARRANTLTKTWVLGPALKLLGTFPKMKYNKL